MRYIHTITIKRQAARCNVASLTTALFACHEIFSPQSSGRKDCVTSQKREARCKEHEHNSKRYTSVQSKSVLTPDVSS